MTNEFISLNNETEYYQHNNIYLQHWNTEAEFNLETEFKHL